MKPATRRSARYPSSGLRYVTNKWGDTRMGIAFGRIVHVQSVNVAGKEDGVSRAAPLSR